MPEFKNQTITRVDIERKRKGVLNRAEVILGCHPAQLAICIDSEIFGSEDGGYSSWALASTLLNDCAASPACVTAQRVKEGGRQGGLATAKAKANELQKCRAAAKQIWSRRPALSTRGVALNLIDSHITQCAESTVRAYIAVLKPKKESC